MQEATIPMMICDDNLLSIAPQLFLKDYPSTITELNPFHITFLLCHAVALLTFTVSSITGNFSQVDKLWSILPCVYAWICVVDTRTALMAGLTTLWSIRLTYNFYRRGGYTFPKVWLGEEDYRWSCIRNGSLGGVWVLLTRKWMLVLFNIVFISLIQNWLLLWIASPSLVAWLIAMRVRHCPDDADYTLYLQNYSSLNRMDGIATILFMTALVIETIADNQQYTFQTNKRRQQMQSSQQTLTKHPRFNTQGLFTIVRKPNYAAEQLLWFSYYLFTLSVTNSYIWNWSGGGFLALMLLFQGSGWLTERITLGKYPEYAEYQKNVPLYMPNVVRLCRFGKKHKM